MPEAEVHAKNLKYTFSTSTHEKKIGGIRDNSDGNSNLHAISPTLYQTSNDPKIRSSLPFLPSLTTPFIGDTFRNTNSFCRERYILPLKVRIAFYLLKLSLIFAECWELPLSLSVPVLDPTTISHQLPNTNYIWPTQLSAQT